MCAKLIVFSPAYGRQVLLDARGVAKVADFGLFRMMRRKAGGEKERADERMQLWGRTSRKASKEYGTSVGLTPPGTPGLVERSAPPFMQRPGQPPASPCAPTSQDPETPRPDAALRITEEDPDVTPFDSFVVRPQDGPTASPLGERSIDTSKQLPSAVALPASTGHVKADSPGQPDDEPVSLLSIEPLQLGDDASPRAEDAASSSSDALSPPDVLTLALSRALANREAEGRKTPGLAVGDYRDSVGSGAEQPQLASSRRRNRSVGDQSSTASEPGSELAELANARSPMATWGAEVWTGQTGSARYMAPEVFGHMPYTGKVDIFSFAIVMAELLMRERAYERSYLSMDQIPAAVFRIKLRPSIPKTWPPRITELVQSCWAQEADERPSADELVRQLQDICAAATKEASGVEVDEPMLQAFEASKGCCVVS